MSRGYAMQYQPGQLSDEHGPEDEPQRKPARRWRWLHDNAVMLVYGVVLLVVCVLAILLGW